VLAVLALVSKPPRAHKAVILPTSCTVPY